MMTWLIANIGITMSVLVFLGINTTSPHRFRFLVCFATLCAWLVPWGLFVGLFPDIAPVSLEPVRSAIPDTLSARTVLPAASTFPETGGLAAYVRSRGMLEVFVVAAGFIGACAFVVQLCLHRRFIRFLESASRPGGHLWEKFPVATSQERIFNKVEIRIQAELPGAMTSGMLYPRIWVHEDLEHDPNLAAVLLHESRHVYHNDNVYLLAITFIEKVLWWNPLVQVLARQARNLQELGCDEACATRLPEYRSMLSDLVLAQANSLLRVKSHLLDSSIFRDSNFNVRRVKLLERTYIMKTKHIAGTGITLGAAFLSVSLATAQSQEFSMEDIRNSLAGSGMGGPAVNGRMQNIKYQLLINEDATISAYYPDAYLLNVVSTLVDNSKRLKVRRNVDKATNEPVADTTYERRLEVAGQFNIARWRADDKDAYAVALSGGFRNLSLRDALDRLSQESNCDVFQEADVIVMDNCR